MAETNHTSSTTNGDCKPSPACVLTDADPAREGLSRRNAMTMMTAAAAVPTIAFSGASPALASTADRRAWDAGMAKWRNAKQIERTFIAEWDRLRPGYETACARIPHASFKVTDTTGPSFELTTANRDHVDIARSFLERLNKRDGKGPMISQPTAYHELVAAADARNEERVRIGVRTGFAAAGDRVDEALAAVDDIESELLRMPAPDGEALMWKLEFLYGEDAREESGYATQDIVDAYMADARRFLVKGHA